MTRTGLVSDNSLRRAARRSTVRRALFLAVALYACLCLGVHTFSRYLIYSPPAPHAEPASGAEVIETRATDGVLVHALWWPPPPGGRLIAYFHGGGGSVDDDVALGNLFAQRHFGAMLVEYRGYGRSAGPTPTERGLYEDAAAALDEAVRRGVPPARTALWGYSLGTGVAAEMARQGRGSALVLIAAFTSVVDVAAHDAPWLPMGLLFSDRYDTLSKAFAIHVPTLVVHGDHDREIPFGEGRRVAMAIPGAQLLAIPGAGHEDIFDRGSDALFGAAFALSAH